VPVLVPAGTDAAGADGTGSGGTRGSGLPAAPAAETAPAASADPATGLPGSAPATAPGATPSVAPAPGARETPVAAQLAPQLAVLHNAPDGAQTMTVVLTPDALGEVTVQVTITDGTLDLVLRGASEHGRQALADALPELRRELEAAGLSFSRLSVDPDAPRDGGGSRTAEQLLADLRGNGGQQQGQPPHRSRAWSTAATSSGEGPAPALRPSASSGVDIRV
jgi:flagellar hook-length control protein FliK